jgi:hypothetical protein
MAARLVLMVLISVAAWGVWPDAQWQVAAQDGTAQVVVERPLIGSTTSSQVHITGWAADPAAPGPGPGIDAVHVYLDGEPGMPRARFLGTASYGQRRPDVARTLGDERFTDSGFSLLADLPPGTHSLFVYGHSSAGGPQDGWARAAVGNFDVSLIVANATMVQPGPTPAGDSGRYTTGTASWQGGNTCLRYTGAGNCEASVPLSVVTGASCIQWNQRGQCVSYLPADGPSAGSSAPAGAAPARGAPVVPPSVPPVGSGGGARPPGVGVPRVVAPAAEGEEGAGTTAEGEAAPSGPPSGALPAAAPPPAEEGAPPEEAPARAVRVAAPPAAAAAAPARAAAPPPAGVSVAPAVAPAPASTGAGAATSSAAGFPSDAAALPAGASPRGSSGEAAAAGSVPGSVSAAVDPIPLDVLAPVGLSPLVQATQVALAAASASTGVGALQSGCALYLGCGGSSPAQPARPASVAPSSGAPAAPNPLAPAAPAGTTAQNPLLAGGPAAPGPALLPTPTPTPTQCPPFAPCGPAGR